MDADSLASAVNIVKTYFPNLRIVQVKLQREGIDCRTPHQYVKKIVCSLRELERVLPPDAQISPYGMGYHIGLQTRWLKSRRCWYVAHERLHWRHENEIECDKVKTYAKRSYKTWPSRR